MSSGSSLFAAAHPLLPPPCATFDVSATAHASNTKLRLPGPEGEKSGALAALDAGPRLAPLAPGTNLNAPPGWALIGDAFRPYTLFPTQPGGADAGARGASRPPDFISAAENLKKLFAMPYSDAPVSLAVQRIGPTLLLDSAETVSAALRARVAGARSAGAPAREARPLGARPTSEPGRYLAAALRGAAPAAPPRATAPAARERRRRGAQQLLEAKLLYHALSVDVADELSAGEADVDAPPRPVTPPARAADALVLWSSPAEAAAAARDAAGAEGEEEDAAWCGGALQRRAASAAAAPEAADGSAETRWAPPRAAPGSFDAGNQLFEWQLDDQMRLVVDSSLLIFRSPARRPISLKLVSVDERVTQLACMSTWLDNIVASVPELAVCHHKDGVVRGYETLNTEDIPALCDPPFDPAEVLAYGRGVLAFLQRHCTRDKAQYWLYRDAASGTLQLYDVEAVTMQLRDADGHGDGGDDADAPQRGSRKSPNRGEAAATLPPGASSVSGAAMGLLCMRLAHKLPEAAQGARADRWRLLEQALSMLATENVTSNAATDAEAAQAAASVLIDQAALCLYPDALERLGDEATDAQQHSTTLASTEVHDVATPTAAGEAQPLLRLGAPPQAAADVAADAALPPLAVAGAAWAAAAPEAGLYAALRRVRRARAALRSAGSATAAGDAAEAAAAALRGATLLELGRRRYSNGALGAALACAQAATRLSQHAAAALGLLADVHAALRLPRAATLADEFAAQWRDTAAVVASADEDCAAGTHGPGLAPEAQRDAAIAAYGDAMRAAAALQSRVSAPLGTGAAATAGATRLQQAAEWELTGCGTAEALRALRRRQASLQNEAGQAALAAASSRRGGEAAAALDAAEAAFAAAATAFDAAGDAANGALVRRNLSHAHRQRALLSLPRGNADAADATAWRLVEYASAAEACRAAARALRRRDAQPDVWDVVQHELAQALLAEGVLRLSTLPSSYSDEGSNPQHAAAVAALTAAAQALGVLGPRAAADAAVAHYHLGDALARPLLASSAAAASARDRGAAARAEALPARHLRKALAFFTPAAYPADHARTRLKLAALAEASAHHERALGIVAAASPAAVAGLPQQLADALDAAMLRALQEAARAAPPGIRSERARAAFAAALRSKAADAPLAERLAAAASAGQRDE